MCSLLLFLVSDLFLVPNKRHILLAILHYYYFYCCCFKTPITSSIHDEHVDPEVRFMSADGLKAEHDRLQKMKMKMEGQVEKDNTEDDDADWPSVDQILREEHAHEDDPEHFVMNERELEHQKVLKKQQKDARDKDDDIRHHAWE